MTLKPELREKLERLKREIVDACDECMGKGYLVAGTDPVECDCMVVYRYVMSLTIAHIPQDYWTLNLDDLQVDKKYLDAVSLYIENLETAVSKGLGFVFLGTNGIGKTSLMCEIGKAAIADGFTARYYTAQQYVDTKNSQSKTAKLDELEKPEFILLDEMDKVYINRATRYAVTALEELIRRMISERHCLIICSNLDREAFAKVFGDSIMSVSKRRLKILDVVGEDFSETLQEEWASALTDGNGVNYFDEAIVEKAQQMYRQQERGGFLV